MENGEFETLPTKFKNLKNSHKRHLNLPGHLSAIGYAKKTKEMKRKVEVRTKIVGMRCMYICYLNYQKAQHFSD